MEWDERRCSPKCCTVCEVENAKKNCYEAAYHLTIKVCDCGWGGRGTGELGGSNTILSK